MVFPIGRSAVWPPPLWHHHCRLCCGPPPWGVSHSSADHSRRHDVSAMGLCFTGRLIWISENRWCLYIQNLTSFNQIYYTCSLMKWFFVSSKWQFVAGVWSSSRQITSSYMSVMCSVTSVESSVSQRKREKRMALNIPRWEDIGFTLIYIL